MALQDLWECPTWWKLRGRCSAGPSNGYPGSTTYAKRWWWHCYPGYGSPALGAVFLHFKTGATFNPVRTQRRLVSTSGDHQQETAFISCNGPPSLRQIGTSIPPEDVHRAGWTWTRMNSSLTEREAFYHLYVRNNVFLGAHIRIRNYRAFRWRHNGLDGVSNHQSHDCLLNRLFGCRSKKTSKLRVTGLCAGNSPGTGEFPAQMASNA